MYYLDCQFGFNLQFGDFMGWSKPESNGMGGFRTERTDRGQNESIHGTSIKDGNVDHGNHVHFHKDGATITKDDGTKYTIHKSNKDG
jgi:hypothetical protein